MSSEGDIIKEFQQNFRWRGRRPRPPSYQHVPGVRDGADPGLGVRSSTIPKPRGLPLFRLWQYDEA
jgi:hypothetical protein